MADKLEETELKAIVASEISSAISYDLAELSDKRADALEYYQGTMEDLPAMPGRSKATSRDVADTIGWMLPGIVRVFTASDQMAIYEPVKQGDEDFASQATDYANYIFWKDNDGYRILYNGTHDSLLNGNGIGKIWWDDTERTEISEHSGLTEMDLAKLLDEEGVEVLTSEQDEDTETVPQIDPQTGQPVVDPQTGQPVLEKIQTWSVKIKRTLDNGRVQIDTIAAEDFLKDQDCIDLCGDWRFLAHRSAETRSSLIEMGFDKAKVEELPADGLNRFAEETIARHEDRVVFEGAQEKSQEHVELYECYLKADVDGDGISETVQIWYAGNAGGGDILEWEVCEDDHPFFDLPCEPIPHRWEARSIADDTKDIQRIKTALIRQTLDNLYASNLPMPDVEEGSIRNMEALLNPQFGVPILRKVGSQPINWQKVPFVAGDSLNAISYFDEVIEKRTGVSRTMMALDPEVLQNQTATASNNAKDAAYSQVELIARNHAELGWRVMFKKLLKLIVKHQDKPRTIRLRDEWVPMDPRQWNSNMDVTINVGLGTGSRDRDMAMLQSVMGNQKLLIDYAAGAGFGEIALEMLPKVLNAMRKNAEAAGIRNVDAFYPEINDQELQQLKQQMAQKAQQPDPKAQADMQKAQADQQLQQAKMQSDVQMQQAKLQADGQSKQAEFAMKQQDMQNQADLKRYQIDMEMQLKREQLQAELELKRQQLEAELQLKREMGMVDGFVKTNSALSSNVRPGGEPG